MRFEGTVAAGRTRLPTERVGTLKEVAKAFGVSYDTVKKEWRAAGMPGKPGDYRLDEIRRWKVARSRDQSIEAEDELTEALLKLKARKLAAEVRVKEADAEKRELANREAKGELIDKRAEQQLFSQLILAARARLLTIPETLMPRFPRAQRTELAEEVRRQIELVLTEMADWRPT